MQDAVFPFEFMGDPPTEAAVYKWMHIIAEGAAKLGRPWTNVQHYKKWFEEVGFENVVEKKYYFPLNPWAKGKYYKELSVYAQKDFMNALEGMSLRIMGSMGWSADEVRAYLPAVIENVKDTKTHVYAPL